MAYTDDYMLSNDPTFQSRIRMSMIKAAIAIANSAKTADATIDKKRTTLAALVLNSPLDYITRFTLAAIEAGIGVGQPLTSGSSDANIDSAISSVWSDIAGVTAYD